jgi:NADPH-dependent 2,4-dienoyl-CoA reductase/sulfur reductase-like enzyme
MVERLVVIGGDGAGMAAATQARRLRPFLEIVALERGGWTSYSACGIPYLVGGEVAALDDLVVRTPQALRDEHRIDVRLHQEAMALDLDAGSIEVRDHQHRRAYTLAFDQLHLATGARPTRPDLPGIDGDRVRGVQTLEDARALLDLARTSRCEDVVVVGGGYIGIEMAEAFVRRGARVTLVERGSQLLGNLDADMAERVLPPLAEVGVEVRLGAEVTGFEPGRLHLGEDASLPADLVVLGLGVTPNADLAVAAGLATGARGAIVVDRRQRTSAPGVYSAGDCATSVHLVSGQQVHVALGTVANKQGRVAGTNLGGGYATFPGVVGTALTKVCHLDVARTGLTEGEARAAGFEPVAATVESTTQAGYLPDPPPIAVKLVAERGTGRLLGGQIVGGRGAGKRIDTIAVALHAGLRVEEVADLDLGYAPPMGTVWDPVAIAARRLA